MSSATNTSAPSVSVDTVSRGPSQSATTISRSPSVSAATAVPDASVSDAEQVSSHFSDRSVFTYLIVCLPVCSFIKINSSGLVILNFST